MNGPWAAPTEDGGLLIDPPLAQVRELLHVNSRRFERAEAVIAGTDLRVWRSLARRFLQRLSEQIAFASGEEYPRIDPERPVVMAGHQPELFHPGVWVKDFALSGLARRHQLNPVNLIVDNDTVKSTALHLPDLGDGSPSAARLATLPFDARHGETLYEERRVHDPALFADFAERAGAITQRWPFRPMLGDFWPDVVRRSATVTLGDCFSAARRVIERRWGCHNAELPLRHICDSQLFHAFASHILADLPKFHSVHNTCLRSFRRSQGLQSHNHPVPDLASDGDWLEAPFWVRRPGESRRERLFARPAGEKIELRGSAGPLPGMRWNADQPRFSREDLLAEGFCIRTRALTTTMFARLFLADLFIHGIGGGKYDELTDMIIKHYLHIEPPAYMVVSATLRLPFKPFSATIDSLHELQRKVRDLYWNPQRFEWGSDGNELEPLIAERERLNGETPTDRADRRERFQQIRAVTERLRQRTAGDPRIAKMQGELVRCEQGLAANEVLRRRDYAFCLYPEEQLRAFCMQFIQDPSEPDA